MKLLDGDGEKSEDKRDVVQFVPYRKYQGKTTMLAEEVLAELPKQLCEYKRIVGKKPNPPFYVQMENLKI